MFLKPWQDRPAQLGQPKSIIQIAIRNQTGARCDPASMKLQLQPPVEIDPERLQFRFTHRVRHDRARSIAAIY